MRMTGASSLESFLRTSSTCIARVSAFSRLTEASERTTSKQRSSTRPRPVLLPDLQPPTRESPATRANERDRESTQLPFAYKHALSSHPFLCLGTRTASHSLPFSCQRPPSPVVDCRSGLPASSVGDFTKGGACAESVQDFPVDLSAWRREDAVAFTQQTNTCKRRPHCLFVTPAGHYTAPSGCRTCTSLSEVGHRFDSGRRLENLYMQAFRMIQSGVISTRPMSTATSRMSRCP